MGFLSSFFNSGARSTNTAHDLSKVYPHVTPRSHLQGLDKAKLSEGYILPFGHDLCVTLVEDVGESGHGLSRMILNVQGHTAAQAHELALKNLTAFARTSQFQKTPLQTKDGKTFLACSGHWLVASCIRVPELYEWASGNFQCPNLLAYIPQPYRLFMFPDYGCDFREEMISMIRDEDPDGLLKVSWDLFALSPEGVVPFVEKA